MSDMFTSTPVKKGENDEDDLYLVPSEIFEGGFNVSDVSDAEAAAAAAPADDVIPLSFDSSFEKSNSFVDEEIDSDFDDSIRVDYSDGSKDNSDLLDYKPQPGPRKVLPDISSSTDESSLSVYRVMLPRATIIGANSFDVKLAKDEFQKYFDTATAQIRPGCDIIVLPIFDGNKTYYAYFQPFIHEVNQQTVKVSVYGEEVIGTSLEAPIEMSLMRRTTEAGVPAHELYIDRFYYSMLENGEFFESKKKFKEDANKWPGYGVRGMMLVRIVANVIPGVTIVSLDDAYEGKYSKGRPYNSTDYSDAMKKIDENGGELPEGIPQTLFNHYDDILKLGGREAIDRVIEGSYYGRYGFEGKKGTNFYEVPVGKMGGTAADFKTSACISPRWHIATNFY